MRAQLPLKFELFEARHVAEVVLAQTQRDMPLALVTIRSWASAARDLFRCYGVPVPRVYDEDMARITKGYGKEHVAVTGMWMTGQKIASGRTHCPLMPCAPSVAA